VVRALVVSAISVDSARIEAGEVLDLDDHVFSRLLALGAVEGAPDASITRKAPERKPELADVLARLADRLDERNPR
jgi:hypothetical protein